MRSPQTLKNHGLLLLRQSLKTSHRRWLWAGAIVGLLFLPSWATIVWREMLKGSAELVINAGLLGLGISALWNDRNYLQNSTVISEDRWLGYALIFSSAAGFFFTDTSVSLKALVFAIAVVGMLLSTWGISIFRRHCLASIMILLSIYPNPAFVAIRIWRMFTPENTLERFAAWAASTGLKLLGHSAVANAELVSLPQGSVQVASGCSGFDMAFIVAGCSILVGIFLKWSWIRTTGLVLGSIVLALLLNIPRVMLLAIASVYWGKESFDFWHGPWGGQMFSGVLFTIYYYIVMAMLNSSGKRTTAVHQEEAKASTKN